MPGSQFFTYVVTQGNMKLPQWIRIGKMRWGICRIEYEEVKINKVEKRRNEPTSISIDYKDAEFFGFKINSFSKVLETPNLQEGLISWAVLDECEVVNDRVCLPINWYEMSVSLTVKEAYIEHGSTTINGVWLGKFQGELFDSLGSLSLGVLLLMKSCPQSVLLQITHFPLGLF